MEFIYLPLEVVEHHILSNLSIVDRISLCKSCRFYYDNLMKPNPHLHNEYKLTLMMNGGVNWEDIWSLLEKVYKRLPINNHPSVRQYLLNYFTQMYENSPKVNHASPSKWDKKYPISCQFTTNPFINKFVYYVINQVNIELNKHMDDYKPYLPESLNPSITFINYKDESDSADSCMEFRGFYKNKFFYNCGVYSGNSSRNMTTACGVDCFSDGDLFVRVYFWNNKFSEIVSDMIVKWMNN
jgi:hypothetical protein